MSVKRCQREVDSAEFTRWLAFASHEPIGQERLDLLAAMVCHKIVACSPGRKPRPPKVKDFIPEWWPRKQSVEEQIAIFQQFFQAMKK